MAKPLAPAVLAIATLVGALTPATSAQATYNHGGKVHPCIYPHSNAVHLCTIQEYQRLQAQKKAEQTEARYRQQQQEMAAEARAYKKIQAERKRNAPTTEHCYMKNDVLVCQPA
jgi:hypothetical protein